MSRHRVPTVPRFVSYLRVSTDRQGRSGLGLDAQREAVARYIAGLAGGPGIRLAVEYVEIESGKRSDRPQLAAALALCRATGAVLVVAKLDRLARDVDFCVAASRMQAMPGFCSATCRTSRRALPAG